MTTFQAIVYAIVHAFTEVLPVSPRAHHLLMPYLTGWPELSSGMIGSLQLGSALALLIVFRHDYLSLFSSFLQVVIYRRKPRAIDERMPFFVLVSLIFPVIGYVALRFQPIDYAGEPLMLALALAVTAVPLWFLDSYSKKNKGFYDWNWLDAIILGLGEALFMIPGVGRGAGAWMAASSRNYSREGAAKFIFYAATPILIASSYVHLHDVNFHAGDAGDGNSWLTFYTAMGVSLLVSVFAISSFLNQMRKVGLARFALYRVLLAAVVAGTYWYRNR